MFQAGAVAMRQHSPRSRLRNRFRRACLKLLFPVSVAQRRKPYARRISIFSIFDDNIIPVRINDHICYMASLAAVGRQFCLHL